MPSEKRKARKQNYFKAAKKSRKVQEVRRESMALFCSIFFNEVVKLLLEHKANIGAKNNYG